MEILLVAGAEVVGFATLQTAFTAGMTDMVANTFGMISALVPVVIPLLGAGIAVAYGLKFIRKIIKA